MRRQKRRTAATRLLVLSLAAPAARADGPVRAACKAEFEKYCKDVPNGGGRVRACLGARANETSESCREALGLHGPGSAKAPAPAKAQEVPKAQ